MPHIGYYRNCTLKLQWTGRSSLAAPACFSSKSSLSSDRRFQKQEEHMLKKGILTVLKHAR